MKHKALSIRQPWAWLIVHGYKDMENRNWPTDYRGPLLIHATKGMTITEYGICRVYANARHVHVPPAEELPRGGIVGMATLHNCFHYRDTDIRSRWFEGPYGFALTDARPLPLWECRGRLGIFEVNVPEEVLHATA